MPESNGISSGHTLEVNELVKFYSGRKVVNGVSLQVDSGEVVGLLGRNGAGKTTTFKMTVGLVKPHSGSIVFRGTDVSNLPIYQRARLGLGYLPQETSIFQRMSVVDNLNAIIEMLPGNKNREVDFAFNLLKEYKLAHLSKQLAHTLSGGEKRRLEICRAMLTNPKVLLLDEPFSGIDPITVEDLQKVILSLKNRGIGILLTDHNVRETLRVTDRSYIIDEGVVLTHGKPEEVINNQIVRKTYLGENFSL